MHLSHPSVHHRARRALGVAACAVGLVATAATTTVSTASATPSSGVTATTLATADIPAGLLPFMSGPGVATARRITIAPGGTTGWHFHDGQIVGIVESGTLTHPGSDCKPVTYRAGQVIVEPEGSGNTHRGQNLTTAPVVLDVVYLLPKGAPFFEDAPAPPCDR